MQMAKKNGEGPSSRRLFSLLPNTYLCVSQLHLWLPFPSPVFPVEPFSTAGLLDVPHAWPFGSSPTPQGKYSLPCLASDPSS